MRTRRHHNNRGKRAVETGSTWRGLMAVAKRLGVRLVAEFKTDPAWAKEKR